MCLRRTISRVLLQFCTECMHSSSFLHVVSYSYYHANTSQPDWPSFFSPAKDILEYLNKVCKCFGLENYMNFNSEVIGAQWHEQIGKWTVQIRQKLPDGTVKEFEDSCDLLLQCTGLLGFPKLPKVPGLDRFKGKVVLLQRQQHCETIF